MRASSVAVALVLTLTGCSTPGGSLGSAWTQLSGTYELPGFDGCYVKIKGSKVTAVDHNGNVPCVQIDEDTTYTLSISGTLTRAKISGTGQFTKERNQFTEERKAGECVRRRGQWSLEVSTSKDSGKKDEEGPFSGLAGVWTGSAKITFEDTRADCPGGITDATPPFETESGALSWTADILGTSGQVTHEFKEDKDRGDDNGNVGSFEVKELGEGVYEIAGKKVLQLPAN